MLVATFKSSVSLPSMFGEIKSHKHIKSSKSFHEMKDNSDLNNISNSDLKNISNLDSKDISGLKDISYSKHLTNTNLNPIDSTTQEIINNKNNFMDFLYKKSELNNFNNIQLENIKYVEGIKKHYTRLTTFISEEKKEYLVHKCCFLTKDSLLKLKIDLFSEITKNFYKLPSFLMKNFSEF